jgi:Flp pilus assembly pilin Flp
MVRNTKIQRRGVRRQRGQGMTEYIVLVGLIAILLMAAVTKFRDAVGSAFNKAADEVNAKITTQIK